MCSCLDPNDSSIIEICFEGFVSLSQHHRSVRVEEMELGNCAGLDLSDLHASSIAITTITAIDVQMTALADLWCFSDPPSGVVRLPLLHSKIKFRGLYLALLRVCIPLRVCILAYYWCLIIQVFPLNNFVRLTICSDETSSPTRIERCDSDHLISFS